MSGEGWKRRLERAKDLRERLRALDKLRLPICHFAFCALSNLRCRVGHVAPTAPLF